MSPNLHTLVDDGGEVNRVDDIETGAGAGVESDTETDGDGDDGAQYENVGSEDGQVGADDSDDDDSCNVNVDMIADRRLQQLTLDYAETCRAVRQVKPDDIQTTYVRLDHADEY